LKKVGYLTHITALKIKKLPKEIVIIGAGPVGLELGQMLRKFGSEVFILERGPEILRGEKELLQRLREILIKEGIKIETNVKVKKVYQREKKVVVYEKDGKEYQVEGEEILLATGKTPNTQDLDLEKAKVEIDENKAIKVNEYLQTSNPNIFAVGDCNNLPLRLETTAAHEGTIAVLNAFNTMRTDANLTRTDANNIDTRFNANKIEMRADANNKINYREVPWTVFTEPEIAGVGYTEEEVLKELKTCACRVLDFSLVPKALIINRTEGMIKMVINPQTKQILGIHLLAPQAGDLIYSAVLIIKNKMTIDEVIETLPVFPTISEAIKLCALSFYKDVAKLSCCI